MKEQIFIVLLYISNVINSLQQPQETNAQPQKN